MRSEERCEPFTRFSDGQAEFFDHQSDELSSKLTLFENYHRGVLALHVHLSILRNGKRANLCLEMHRLRKVLSPCEEFPVLLEEGRWVAWSRSSCQNGDVQSPVLVSVCEGSESHKSGWQRVSPTLVRLQTLNDCDCLKRNSPERIATNFLVKRTTTSDDGKLMRRFCFLAWVVAAEEFANKIIEAGVGGLENISEHMGNNDEGCLIADPRLKLSPSYGLSVVISLGNEPNVIGIDILRDCFIEDVEMMAYPPMLIEDCFDSHGSSIAPE
jgi:hypothetical protein